MILSIIIPVFNEEKNILLVLEKVRDFIVTRNIKKEVILINDGSTDGTGSIIDSFLELNKDCNFKYLHSKTNKGKGFSIANGIKECSGDLIIFQDADFEYNLNDINRMVDCLVNKDIDAVYGNRYGNKNINQKPIFIVANKTISFLYNLRAKNKLPDVETCYKLIRSELIKSINLLENRFGVEIEISRKLDKMRDVKILSIPIDYNARKYKAGKKIGFIDGLRAIWCIIKY